MGKTARRSSGVVEEGLELDARVREVRGQSLGPQVQALALALSSAALLLGLYMLASEQISWLLVFLVFSYGGGILTLATTLRTYKDLAAPISILWFLGLFRFAVPALLIGVQPEQLGLFQYYGIDAQHWQLGHVLALSGMCGVNIGWNLKALRQRPLELRFQIPSLLGITSTVAMLAGLVFLVGFVRANSSLGESIVSGTFRATSIREGTGFLFYLALTSVGASVALTGWLVSRGHNTLVSASPVLLVGALYFILGGRARALTAPLAAVILLWYVGARRPAVARSWRKIVLVLVGLVALLWLAYVGTLYRGGAGIRAFRDAASLTELTQAADYLFIVDVGQLHALAGATIIGPGALEGGTFSVLLWPFNELLDLPGRSSGVFIVENTAGLVGRRWGFHPTLIGDAFLNWGLPGALAVPTAAGWLAHQMYARFRRGRVSPILYALALVYGMRLFFESIDKWGEMVVVLGTGLLLIRVSALFEQKRTGIARPVAPRLHRVDGMVRG